MTHDIEPSMRPELVHYKASAAYDDILSALAALDSEGLAPDHVQYITDDDHYEVDVDRLDDAEPSL